MSDIQLGKQIDIKKMDLMTKNKIDAKKVFSEFGGPVSLSVMDKITKGLDAPPDSPESERAIALLKIFKGSMYAPKAVEVKPEDVDITEETASILRERIEAYDKKKGKMIELKSDEAQIQDDIV